MAFTRWDPLRDLLALQEQIGQLVGTDTPGWNPPIDLYENAVAFILTAEIPGLTRQDVEIHVEDNRLVVRGERSGQVPCEQYHRVERGHGRFQRTFVLPESVDVTGVVAELKDGVLAVTVPKSGARGARHIPVS